MNTKTAQATQLVHKQIVQAVILLSPTELADFVAWLRDEAELLGKEADWSNLANAKLKGEQE